MFTHSAGESLLQLVTHKIVMLPNCQGSLNLCVGGCAYVIEVNPSKAVHKKRHGMRILRHGVQARHSGKL